MMKFTLVALVLVAVALASVEAGPGPRPCAREVKACKKLCKRKGLKKFDDKK